MIKIPKKFMGEPIKGSLEKVLADIDKAPTLEPEPSGTGTHTYHNGFVYIPTANLWFAEEITLTNTNWYDCHKELAKQTLVLPNGSEKRLRMPTPKQTWGLILYAKAHQDDPKLKKIYNDILQKKPENKWRAEWQNARFIAGSGFNDLDLETVIGIDSSGNLKTTKQPLEPCLGKSCYAKLNINSQGFLTEKSQDTDYNQEENIYFWPPVNGRVARFVAGSGGAGLSCGGGPQFTDVSLGVRASAEGAS